jgi:phosphoribosylglycinamide formyltransferase-1
MKNIAIFASGSGSNAENIIKYFSTRNNAKVSLVLANNPKAYVIKRAEAHNVDTVIFDRDRLYTSGEVLGYLNRYSIDFIVLAGFLWLVPDEILESYPGRVVNIHPALLPLYGGKGMYGERVHKAVIDNKEKESGITIHFVNSRYDEGGIIFQAKCNVESNDTPETLAEKIHKLEHLHFPQIIDKLISEPED